MINPPATTIKSKSAAKTSITANFVAKKGGVHYQLGYKKSSESSYKSSNSSSTSKTIKSLTQGTTYNLKVRTYKVVSGKTYYSAWSKVVSLKTKGTLPKNNSDNNKTNTTNPTKNGGSGSNQTSPTNNNSLDDKNNVKCLYCQYKKNGKCKLYGGYYLREGYCQKRDCGNFYKWTKKGCKKKSDKDLNKYCKKHYGDNYGINDKKDRCVCKKYWSKKSKKCFKYKYVCGKYKCEKRKWSIGVDNGEWKYQSGSKKYTNKLLGGSNLGSCGSTQKNKTKWKCAQR